MVLTFSSEACPQATSLIRLSSAISYLVTHVDAQQVAESLHAHYLLQGVLSQVQIVQRDKLGVVEVDLSQLVVLQRQRLQLLQVRLGKAFDLGDEVGVEL